MPCPWCWTYWFGTCLQLTGKKSLCLAAELLSLAPFIFLCWGWKSSFALCSTAWRDAGIWESHPSPVPHPWVPIVAVPPASRSGSSRAARPRHCHRLLPCSLLGEVAAPTSWPSWLCLMPPRADIRLLLQKGRAERPLLPGTFSAEGFAIPSWIPGRPGREDLPPFASFTGTSFQAEDPSGFFPWCCREKLLGRAGCTRGSWLTSRGKPC